MKTNLLKTALLSAAMLMFVGTSFAFIETETDPGGGAGCTVRPSENNGHCVESTANGTVTYLCADEGSKNCVK